MRLNLVQREAFDPSGSEKEVAAANRATAALREKVKEQERWVAGLQKAEALQLQLRLDEAARANVEDAQTLELEISLMGRSRQEREQILAQRRIEVDLAKELASIDKLNASDTDKDALRAKARDNARQKGETDSQRRVLDEWERTADSINQSLTDALIRGFENGKDAAKSLRGRCQEPARLPEADLQPAGAHARAEGGAGAGLGCDRAADRRLYRGRWRQRARWRG
jgi:hypothetical protein